MNILSRLTLTLTLVHTLTLSLSLSLSPINFMFKFKEDFILVVCYTRTIKSNSLKIEIGSVSFFFSANTLGIRMCSLSHKENILRTLSFFYTASKTGEF